MRLAFATLSSPGRSHFHPPAGEHSPLGFSAFDHALDHRQPRCRWEPRRKSKDGRTLFGLWTSCRDHASLALALRRTSLNPVTRSLAFFFLFARRRPASRSYWFDITNPRAAAAECNRDGNARHHPACSCSPGWRIASRGWGSTLPSRRA